VIRVVIADDDTLVRAGIRALVERDPDISVTEAADGAEAIAALGRGADVGLLDLRMPRHTGIEVVEAIAAWPQPPPCLLLTTFDDRDALLAGLRAGVRGYLRKDVTIDTLLRAIRAIADGRTFFQPSLTEKLRLGVRRTGARGVPPPPVLLEPLTPRETEVMRLVAGGYSNHEIGELLGAADGTIKVHVSSILAKLGVRDRVQAVLRAIEAGVI
jgi:DNA-binding NarL/FixJ family response regulator